MYGAALPNNVHSFTLLDQVLQQTYRWVNNYETLEVELHNICGLSGNGEMEWLNGTVEWNGGMEYWNDL